MKKNNKGFTLIEIIIVMAIIAVLLALVLPNIFPSDGILLVLPKGTTVIGRYMFYDCDTLITVKIPEGVTGIKTGAFEKCDNLASVNIPESVQELSIYCFHKCGSLSLDVPDSVTTIGRYAFTSLIHVTYHGPCKNYTPWGALSFN